MTGTMPSPCVGVCETSSDHGLCVGCGRTEAEIDAWKEMDAEAKGRVFAALAYRRAKTGVGAPVVGHPIAVLDRGVLESLDDPKATWSIGVPGAVARFCASEGNVLISPRLWEYGGYVVGAYGGVRVVLDHKAKTIKPIGDVDPETNQVERLHLCLYRDKAMMSRRTTLTEVGTDTEALRVRDRPSALFDLGLGIPHLDYCIRVEDDELIRSLRGCVGRSVFEDGSPIPALIADETRAQRVVLTRLGRIEVWGSISERSGEGEICTGTTFDPTLFDARNDRPADSAIPATLVPVMSLTPGRELTLF